MDIISMIGLVAAALSTISLLPQLIRVWKTKSVKDLSTAMCSIMCTSVVLWLTYGLLAADTPLMASNSVVLAQTVAILGLKAKYGFQPAQGSKFTKLATKLRLQKPKDENVDQQGASTELQFLL
ncbi:MAG: SemiSWEET transporter [Candidatus Bathyarchaeota archaeon]|nr:SemiSWEET transporter [Candidatus Bathyarchaeota archaeon]